MYYLSKGRFIKRRRKRVVVFIFGSRHTLNEQQSRLWLEGLNGFVEINEQTDMQALFQLVEDGFAILCEKNKGRERFLIFTKCIMCVYKRKGRTFFYGKREKEVLLWLRYHGMRLNIEELIFLFENKIAPTPELLRKGNEETVRRLIYPSPVIVGNPLRNKMAVALCRDEVISAVLKLIKKREIFLI